MQVVVVTVPEQPAPTVAGAPVAASYRWMTYPATAVPPASVAAVQRTLTELPEADTDGVFPVGIVVAEAPAVPLPAVDHAAIAAPANTALAATATRVPSPSFMPASPGRRS